MKSPPELFAPYEVLLAKLASEMNLEVEKYRHDVAMWSFSAPHPKYGMMRVDIQINQKGEVFLLKWLFGDLNSTVYRPMRNVPGKKLSGDAEALIEDIKLAFAEIAQWPALSRYGWGFFASYIGLIVALMRLLVRRSW